VHSLRSQASATTQAWPESASATPAASAGRSASIASASASGRIVEPQDIANAVAWLAGPESTMIVGQTLINDGGYSLPA
jgi:NAD(P)-dependent dehydrogenase (short-subunit alcohol dehydrogenase family)